MSIFRYLKQLANELPQPADVPSVPASTIVVVNRIVESTLPKRRLSSYNRYSYRNKLDVVVNRIVETTLPKRHLSSYNRYSYRNKLDIGRYAVVYGTSSAVRKYSKALCIDIR